METRTLFSFSRNILSNVITHRISFSNSFIRKPFNRTKLNSPQITEWRISRSFAEQKKKPAEKKEEPKVADKGAKKDEKKVGDKKDEKAATKGKEAPKKTKAKKEEKRMNVWDLIKGQSPLEKTRGMPDREKRIPDWLLDMCNQFNNDTLVKPIHELTPADGKVFIRRVRKLMLNYNNYLKKKSETFSSKPRHSGNN